MTTCIYYEQFFGEEKNRKAGSLSVYHPPLQRIAIPTISKKPLQRPLLAVLLTLVSLPSFYHHSLKKFSKK